MDVDRSTFWHKLPSIIDIISRSHAISLDLELSGISKSTEEIVNPTLKQKYEDARQVAETFAILQLGLTCITWHEETGSYLTRTFNIPLTPAILGGDKVSNELASKMEREICFSSKTISFLQSHNFKLSQVFEKGVPFLSDAEATKGAVLRFLEQDTQGAHINIYECPQETQNFYKMIECHIQAWLADQVFKEKPSKTLILKNPYQGRFRPFQKRLIHQMVETRFHGYGAHNMNGSMYMEIRLRNPKEDSKVGRYTLAKRKQAVAKQTGARYLWDAMRGGRFATEIDPDLVVGEKPDMINALRNCLLECEGRLKKWRPIIVGHNMLWDMCFLFKTFSGLLPEFLDEFQRMVKDNFPKIVDTKYLFTRGGHEMMPDHSLEECFTLVKEEVAPLITTEPMYSYDKAAPHDAGYDSYMTGVVFLKKSYKLAQDKHGLEYIAGEDPADKDRPVTKPTAGRSDHFARPSQRKPRGPRHPDRPEPRSRGVGTSESLLDGDDDSLAELMMKFEPLKPTATTVSIIRLPVSTSNPAKLGNNDDKEERIDDEDKNKKGSGVPARKIPEWGSVFWKKYGNKVRVGQSGLMMYTGGRL